MGEDPRPPRLDVADDDTDTGWGESTEDETDQWLLEQRPPHHGS